MPLLLLKRILPFGVLGILAIAIGVIVENNVGTQAPTLHLAHIRVRPKPAPRPSPSVAGPTHTAPPSTTANAITPPTATTTTTATTSKTATAVTGGTAAAPPTTAEPGRPAVYACDQNINATTRTGTPRAAACAVAENAFYEVYRASEHATTVPGSVRVWDPTASAYVAMTCHDTHATVSCLASDGRASTFPMAAIKAYTPALAAKFTAGRNLGPAG